MLRFIASVAVVMLAGLSGASAWPDQPISEYQSSGDDRCPFLVHRVSSLRCANSVAIGGRADMLAGGLARRDHVHMASDRGSAVSLLLD
jgi:hypothetical protein